MKKHIILVLLLVCTLCLLAACNGGAQGTPAGSDTQTGTQAPNDATAEGTTGSGDNGNSTPSTANKLALVENGVSTYSIVHTRSSDATLSESAEKIQSMIYAVTKVRLPIVETAEVTEGDRVIVVGTSNSFAPVATLKREIGIGEYGYCLRNNMLLIVGNTNTSLNRALTKFLAALSASSSKGGNLLLDVGETGVFFNTSGWLSNVPRIAKDYSSIYDSGDNTYMLYYQNIEATACDELDGLIAQNGTFRKSQGETTTIGNRTATYVRDDGEISYIWQKNAKSLSVVYQSYTEAFVTAPSVSAETGYTKTGEAQFALLPLNYTVNCKEPTDCSGFSAVMTLEDGRFIIIDGGYTADAHALYNYLYDHNRRSDGITIAAWILTHSHGDHIGAFQAFVKTYAKKVNCEYLVSNALPSTITMEHEGSSTALSNLSTMQYAFANNNTRVLKMHAGQSVWFCNTELRMLFTHENYYPTTPAWLNPVSLVFQLRVNGQTILITGDCELDGNDKLVRMWSSELKADIFQINHHGYSGVVDSVVNYVDPTIALWPTSQTTADYRNTATWCGGALQRLLARVDEYIVADGTVKILTLPYQHGGTVTEYTMDFEKRS